jgi:hypothetical protein
LVSGVTRIQSEQPHWVAPIVTVNPTPRGGVSSTISFDRQIRTAPPSTIPAAGRA